jgi:WD40 repeat protein
MTDSARLIILLTTSVVSSSVLRAQEGDPGVPAPAHQSRPFRHAGLAAVALSPDGKRVLTGSHDGLIKYWDADTRTLIRKITGHERNIRSLAFSPDGKTALSASYDQTARLWDMSTGAEIRGFRGHAKGLEAARFSADGAMAVTGGQDNQIIVWEVSTASIRVRLTGHEARVTSCVFSPDGKLVLSGSGDRTARLWDVNSGRQIHVFTGHDEPVRGVAYCPDGALVASASWDGDLRLWNPSTGEEVRRMRSPPDEEADAFRGRIKINEPFWGVEFLPFVPPQILATGNDSLWVWDASSGMLLRRIYGMERTLSAPALSADGKRALIPGMKSLVLWDLETGDNVYYPTTSTYSGHAEPVRCVAISPDGATALSGGEDNTVRWWEVATGREIHVFWGHTREVVAVAFASDGRTATSIDAGGRRSIRRWDLERKEDLDAIKATPRGYPGDQALSGDGRYAAVIPRKQLFAPESDETVLQVWDTHEGRIFASTKLPDNDELMWCLSPDGTKVGVCVNPDLQLGDRIPVPESNEQNPEAIDKLMREWEARVAAELPQTPVAILDAASGREVGKFAGHRGPVTALAFSPDGTKLLTSGQRSIALWNLDSRLNDIAFETGVIPNGSYMMSWSSDGSTVASLEMTGYIVLWDAATGRERDSIPANLPEITCLALSRDARFLAAGSPKGVKVWRISKAGN